MKILVVTQYFYPEALRVSDIALAFKERGHEVTVLTGLPNYPLGSYFPNYSIFGPYYEVWNGIKVKRVPLISRGKRRGLRLILNYLSFALFGSLIAPLRCRERYDAIFVYEVSPVTVGLPAIMVKLFTSSKIYFWIGDLWPDTLVSTGILKEGLILKAVNYLVNFIYSNCEMLLVSTPGFKRLLLERGQVENKIAVWPQWAEDHYLRLEFNEHELPRAEIPDGFVVMFAGNLGGSQAFDVVLKAFELLKAETAIKLVIVGDGLKRRWIEEQILERKLDRQIFLLGFKDVSKMPFYLHLADVLLVSLNPDPLFALTMPGKVASCLASSKPIVGSVDGEAAQVISESGAGIVAAAGDAEALAAAILKMFNTEDKVLAEMGQKGRYYYQEHFDRTTLVELFEKLVSEGKQAKHSSK